MFFELSKALTRFQGYINKIRARELIAYVIV